MPPSESSSHTERSPTSESRLWSTYEQLHRLSDLQLAGIGLLVPDQHAEEGGLARAVRADDAHDAAAGQDEVDVVHQQVLAVRLAQALGLDHQVAQARAGRNRDLGRLVALLRGLLLREQVLVVGEAGLALGLAGAGGHAHPLELALQALGAVRLFLLFLGEPGLLLIEPGGVVPLPGHAGAAVQLEDPARHVVEEVAVVGDGDDVALVLLQEALEPGHRLRVEVVRGLVEQQHVGGLEQQAAQGHAPALAARQLGHVGIAGGHAQRVHRHLDVAVELPEVGGVDLVLELRELVGGLVGVVRGQLLVAVEDLLLARHRLLDVLEHGLPGIELRLLGQVADPRPRAGNASPAKSLSSPAMMRSSVLLPEPLGPMIPILASG